MKVFKPVSGRAARLARVYDILLYWALSLRSGGFYHSKPVVSRFLNPKPMMRFDGFVDTGISFAWWRAGTLFPLHLAHALGSACVCPLCLELVSFGTGHTPSARY